MSSLYELTKHQNEVLEEIYQNGGEVSDELEKKLTEVDFNVEKKVDGYFAVLDRIKSEVVDLKAKRDKYIAVIQQLERLERNLKSRAKLAMLNLKVTTLDGSDESFTLSKNQPKLKVVNEGLIPDVFFDKEWVSTLDKQKLKKAIMDGDEILGAELEPVYRIGRKIKRGVHVPKSVEKKG